MCTNTFFFILGSGVFFLLGEKKEKKTLLSKSREYKMAYQDYNNQCGCRCSCDCKQNKKNKKDDILVLKNSAPNLDPFVPQKGGIYLGGMSRFKQSKKLTFFQSYFRS
jgi:hypothetical protein